MGQSDPLKEREALWAIFKTAGQRLLTRIKLMQIHQLSLSHVREQDRILVRIKSTTADEFRLWLTRRMSLRLIPMLEKVVADQLAKSGSPDTSHLIGADEQTRQLMSEFQGSEALKQADFATPYDSDVRNLPLGVEPLLVTDISFTPLKNDQLEVVFSEPPKAPAEPRSLRMVADLSLAHSFIHMLKKCFAQAHWGDVSTGADLAATGASQELASQKPRYLN